MPKTMEAVNPPPLEVTNEEYQDLVQTATSLTPQEAQSELVECARYGEVDAVRALLQVWSDKVENFVNVTDDYGSTALHKAAASGHESTVQLLLFYKAKHLPNHSGKNTPLHWAAANGHEKIVEMILNHHFDYQPDAVDVLAKNSGGRSALTEGFTSQKTKLVGMLLEHDSAAEERLLRGGDGTGTVQEINGDGDGGCDDDDDDADGDGDDGDRKEENGTVSDGENGKSNSSMEHFVIHEFDFLRDPSDEMMRKSSSVMPTLESTSTSTSDLHSILGMGEDQSPKTLLVRELPIENADNPFDEGKDKLDTTGLGIWSASLVMARWVANKAMLGRFDGKNVLELGAGCGVPGLAVGMYSAAKHVYITDYNPVTMDNLKYNIDMNANRPSTQSSAGEWLERVTAKSIDWDDETTWPKEKMDYLIGSDLIYQKSIVSLLLKVVHGLIKDDGIFLYTCPSGGRDGLLEFLDAMKKQGFYCYSEEVAPDVYRSNPLSNGDEDEAFVHFHELHMTEYKLYEFRKKTTP